MNYVVKLFSSGQKYIFVLLVLILISACSSLPPAEQNTKVNYLSTVAISKTETQVNLEKTYGGKTLVFRPEAGFAIIGFAEHPGLTTLSVEDNVALSSPEVTALGGNAWGGGTNSWASGVNSWGTGSNAWGGGSNAWGGGANAWGSGTNAWGTGTNAWGSGNNAWGSGNTTIPALPSDNRFMLQSIRLPQAHTISRNFGAGVKVAVIDTGIDLNHPLFIGRLAPSSEWKDFMDGDSVPQEVAGNFYGHGTGVAGLIAQTAPRATILPIRVLGADGIGDVANIVMAIDWAVQKGANVINLSLGTNEDIASFKQAVEYAAQAGVYVVAAAGNEGSNNLLYPAKYMTSSSYNDMMFSVGSYGSALLLSIFCNNGPELEYVAPGELMMSAYPDLRVARYSGSSFATPIVAGAVALAQGEASGEYKWWIDWYLDQSSTSLGSNLGKRIDVTNLLRNVPGFVHRKALLVVGSTTLSSTDSLIKSRLENMGYTVATKSGSVTSTDAAGKDMLFISSSIGSSTQLSLRDVTVPIVVGKADWFDNFKLTNVTSGTDFGLTSSQLSLSIKNTHPIASGYSTLLPANVFSSSASMAWGKPSSSAIIIGVLSGDSSKSSIFAYDKGVTMAGMVAPARRVGLFAEGGANVLTLSGWQLFESAVTWATSGN